MAPGARTFEQILGARASRPLLILKLCQQEERAGETPSLPGIFTVSEPWGLRAFPIRIATRDRVARAGCRRVLARWPAALTWLLVRRERRIRRAYHLRPELYGKG